MANLIPILRIHLWGYPGTKGFSIILLITTVYYLLFAVLFMQLEGLLRMSIGDAVRNDGGSAWESNPPGTVLAPHTGFEVREPHQPAAHFRLVEVLIIYLFMFLSISLSG